MEKLRQACKDLGAERDAYRKKMKDAMQKCTYFKEEMISERYKADNAKFEANEVKEEAEKKQNEQK